MSENKFSGLSQVSHNFLRLAEHPVNIGSIEDCSAKANSIGQCGDSMEVFLKIEGEVIKEVKVRPHGCIYTWVCASAMSEMAQGRQIDEALRIEPEELAGELGGLPEDHLHCARLAVNALGEAIGDYYKANAAQGVENPVELTKKA